MITTYKYLPNNPATIPSSVRQQLLGKVKSRNLNESKGKKLVKGDLLVVFFRKINASLTAEIALAKSNTAFCLTTAYRTAYESSVALATKLKVVTNDQKSDPFSLDAEMSNLISDYFILNEELYNLLVRNSLDFSDEKAESEWGAALVTKEDWQNG